MHTIHLILDGGSFLIFGSDCVGQGLSRLCSRQPSLSCHVIWVRRPGKYSLLRILTLESEAIHYHRTNLHNHDASWHGQYASTAPLYGDREVRTDGSGVVLAKVFSSAFTQLSCDFT